MEKSLEDYPIYLSVADVAKILGVSGITVRRMIREKKLTTVRVGRLYRIPKAYQYRTNRINDYFGEKRLRDIHVFEVEQFLDELFTVKDLSPRTVKDTKSLFSTIMDQAVKDEVVFFNPVKEAVINKNLAEEHTEEKDLDDDFFSFEESEVFLRIAFGHELYELFYCALFFGMRRGEALGIRWSSVDLEQKTLTINHTVTKGMGVNRLNSAKTNASIRQYPLTDAQVEMFRSLKKKEKQNRKLFGDDYVENEYIFKHQDGKPYYPDYPTKAFAKLIKKNPELPQRVTFHGLRSSCVSILVHKGYDLKGIQKWVGHADISITLKIYTKVKENIAKLEISQGMDSFMKPLR